MKTSVTKPKKTAPKQNKKVPVVTRTGTFRASPAAPGVWITHSGATMKIVNR